jgi:hypothetical protein
MPKVTLNGQTFSDKDKQIAGLNEITATIRHESETGGSAFSFTGELTFYGEAYEIIRQQILLAPTPHLIKVPIQIYSDECPDIPFIGYIEGGSVRWCEISSKDETCSASAQIIDGSTIAEKLACVKNTIIWKRLPKFGSSQISAGEDTTRKARYLAFCVQPRPAIIFEMMMIYYLLMRVVLTPVIIVVGLIVKVINLIITAVNTIPFLPNIQLIDFDGNDDTGVFEEFGNILDRLNNFITGCGAKHKTPFIHSYVQNVCEICGLTLQSSILSPGGYYHNLMRLDAPSYSTRPGYSNNKIEEVYQRNSPNLNGAQLLDEMERNLNWEWWIQGSVLRVEPRGEVEGLIWVEQGDGTEITSFCLETTDETVKAFGVYEYAQDAADRSANEVRKDWSEVIDWNVPPNDIQRGALERTLQYSTALFRKDNNGDGVMPIDEDFYNTNAAFPNLLNWKNVLILSNGVSSLPKLLIWDGVSPQDNARVQRWKVPGTDKWDYNIPMWMKKTHPAGPTLYNTSFEKTDNPRLAGVRLRTFTMDILLTCDLLKTAPEARLVKAFVQGELKTGKIDEITIHYATMTASIKGKI